MHRTSAHRWPWQKSADAPRPTQAGPKVIDDNIRAVDEYRAEVERGKGLQDHVADWITHWSGSMVFVYLHVAWFAVWISVNQGWLGVRPFDPFPYGLLTTIVSLEAIFLSTFVLVSQNRQAQLADRRSELDLQINLLAEHEMTRVLALVDAIAKHIGCEECDEGELSELKEDVRPKDVLRELEARSPETKRRPAK